MHGRSKVHVTRTIDSLFEWEAWQGKNGLQRYGNRRTGVERRCGLTARQAETQIGHERSSAAGDLEAVRSEEDIGAVVSPCSDPPACSNSSFKRSHSKFPGVIDHKQQTPALRENHESTAGDSLTVAARRLAGIWLAAAKGNGSSDFAVWNGGGVTISECRVRL